MGFGMPMTISLLLLFLPVVVNAQIDGEKIFKTYCSACHMSNDKKLIGPGLAGMEDRWEDRDLLYRWIKNSSEVLKEGDPYVTAMFEEYNKMIMPPQAVNDEEIDAILAYISSLSSEAESAAVATGEETNVALAEEGTSIPNWIVALGIVVLLLIVISLLRNLKYSLLKVQAEKDGLEAPIKLSMVGATFAWINRNKTFFAVIMIVFTVGLAKAGWDWLLDIGIYEGYEPVQPINFSHKVHAGAQKIDCNYCHSSARNSRTSGIPSANVCMNCHTYIQEGPLTGTKEISKIYAAIGWDPESRSYSAESTGPIKWVKVHNLPDHAYYNHSQHVTVGKIACQTCHGPVEEMDVVRQFSPLTMGWCITCHREHKVNMDGNAYYDEIHARMSEDIKDKIMKDGKITVSELGGMECAKCHY